MEAKVVQEGKERVLIVAVDFDGCLGNSAFADNYKLMQKELPKDCTPQQRETAFKALIKKSNPALVQDIVQRSQEYDRIVVMVGSNRQSANKDQHDAQKNKNGSCFEATDMLAKVLAEQTQKPIDLDKYLVFDSILELPAGTNFDLKQQEFPEVAKQYEMSMDKKYRLAYFQMQEVCARYPDASLSYVHYDDRNDIVSDTARAFKAEQGQHLPPNLVKATACHYELYNPYAILQSMGNDARKQAQENPDQIVDNTILVQLATALEIIDKDAESSGQMITRHQNTISKVQKQRDELVEKRKKMPKNHEEYKGTTNKINTLDTALSQLQKPQQTKDIIKKVRELCRQSSGNDLPNCELTWLTVRDMLNMADKLLNINLREHYLSPFPELKAEYERSSNNRVKENVSAQGEFTRSVEEGHHMEMTTFDQTVKECMKDSSIAKLVTFGSFVAEEKRLRPIADIENAIKSASFEAEMIDDIEISERHKLLEPVKKGFVEGKINSIDFGNAMEKFNLSREEILEIRQNGILDKRLFSDNAKIDSFLNDHIAQINNRAFSADSLDLLLGTEGLEELDQSRAKRILEPIEKAFMSGKISFDTLSACYNKLFSAPDDKLRALNALYNQVTESNNTLYSPPKNPLIRFLKGLAGKENYSSKRLSHIAQIQNEYLKIVKDNKDIQEVKSHVASSTLPDWETRHMYIGINHATKYRKQLLALYGNDPNMTIQQLFTLSTESESPFKSEGVEGFIATFLLGAKRRLASFSTEQIARYIADHPKQAPYLLAAYKDDLARNPDTILMILSNPDTHEAVKESKLLESKYLSPEQIKGMYPLLDPKQSQPSISPSHIKNEGRPPIPTIPVAEVIRKERPPLHTKPVSQVLYKGGPPSTTTPVTEVIREVRPVPPSHPAPPPPRTAPIIPPEMRPAMPKTSPPPIHEANRHSPPSYAAPPIPTSPNTVTRAGESLVKPNKPLPPIPEVEKSGSSDDDPSDEEVERAMKVLDRLESTPRPGWAQGTCGTESNDTEAPETPPSSEEESKGPST